MGRRRLMALPEFMRYELCDYEWTAIKPMLPNKPRGVRRVNDRRVLNGIFWVLRSGAPWRDLPENHGPRTTCCNRFVRRRKLSPSACSAFGNRWVFEDLFGKSPRVQQQSNHEFRR
jgi:transposase